jgi:hypothetical protein
MKKNAFSMVEVGLAIAISGVLFVAGTSFSQVLIRNNKVSRILTEIVEYKLGIQVFKSIYQTLPGDYDEANAQLKDNVRTKYITTPCANDSCTIMGNNMLYFCDAQNAFRQLQLTTMERLPINSDVAITPQCAANGTSASIFDDVKNQFLPSSRVFKNAAYYITSNATDNGTSYPANADWASSPRECKTLDACKKHTLLMLFGSVASGDVTSYGQQTIVTAQIATSTSSVTPGTQPALNSNQTAVKTGSTNAIISSNDVTVTSGSAAPTAGTNQTVVFKQTVYPVSGTTTVAVTSGSAAPTAGTNQTVTKTGQQTVQQTSSYSCWRVLSQTWTCDTCGNQPTCCTPCYDYISCTYWGCCCANNYACRTPTSSCNCRNVDNYGWGTCTSTTNVLQDIYTITTTSPQDIYTVTTFDPKDVYTITTVVTPAQYISSPNYYPVSGALTNSYAQALDTKMDDGMPYTGQVLGLKPDVITAAGNLFESQSVCTTSPSNNNPDVTAKYANSAGIVSSGGVTAYTAQNATYGCRMAFTID